MKLGLVVDGIDHFIKPIERNWQEQFVVERFEPSFVRLPLIGKKVNEYRLDQQLTRFLKKQDVVFFEWAASLLIRATQLPKQGCIVARMHSVELATSVEQVNWSHVDHLIVLNQSLKDRLVELVNMPLPPTAIVANGVDLSNYQLRDTPFQYRLGMVCSLYPIKRVYEAILALYQLRQEGYPFTLSIAGGSGDGEVRRYDWALRSLVTKLHLTEVVFFAGYVPDVSTWLHNIDVFISNSYWEGQQMGLIEAMASGKYCLGHCWDGIEEILPVENIFVTDSEFRAKLLTYADLTEDERVQEQKKMRLIAEEKFDEQRMIREIVAIVEQTAEVKAIPNA